MIIGINNKCFSDIKALRDFLISNNILDEERNWGQICLKGLLYLIGPFIEIQ